ncbi:MAG: 50S ribosomal protein L24 [Deltaproteobacteria bacterium]|jgi:large subunit ribosomal protein L24|nr:50S ribosomal protein L24 [Deltaproteobacteria bacterium]
MPSNNFKVGDRLCVVAGPHKNKIGTLKRFFQEKERVLVEGVNLCVKHQKADPNRSDPGGRVKKEKPLHVSNVALVCPKCAEPTWVRHEILTPDAEGNKKRKVRVCKRCKSRIDE